MNSAFIIQILLTLHVLTAIFAVGVTLSYFFWLRRAVLVPEARAYTLETIRVVERRFVIPAYVIVLLTGLGLVDRAAWGWSTPWVELSILFFVVLMGLVGLNARNVKRLIALTEDDEAATRGLPLSLSRSGRLIALTEDDEAATPAEYAAAHARTRIFLLAKAVAVVALVYLMVFKPPLWG